MKSSTAVHSSARLSTVFRRQLCPSIVRTKCIGRVLALPPRGLRVVRAAAAELEEVQVGMDAATPEVSEAPAPTEEPSTIPRQEQQRGRGGYGSRGGGRGGGRGRPPRVVSVPFDTVEVGQWLDAKVVSITPYGAFVDYGGATDGLVHISQLTESYVKNVNDVVEVGQVVKVRILGKEDGKLKMSMLEEGAVKPPPRDRAPRSEYDGDTGNMPLRGKTATRGGKVARGAGGERGSPKTKEIPVSVGEEVDATVANVKPFGVFVDLGNNFQGLLHISGMVTPDGNDVEDPRTAFNLGDKIKVRVVSTDARSGKVQLTMKTEEMLQQEKELIKGISSSAPVSPGKFNSTLGFALARAGISKTAYVDLAKEPEAEAEAEPAVAAGAPPAVAVPAPEPEAKVEAPPAPEPVAETPVAEAPVEETPVPEPMAETPVAETPVEEPPAPEPVAETPVEEPAAPEPVAEAPVAETPVEEPPAPEPVAETPVVEPPAPEPVAETPVAETPVEEPPAPEPVAETPVEEPPAPEPVAETPVAETPVEETPAPEPVAETPVVEPPAPEPVVEASAPEPVPEPVAVAAAAEAPPASKPEAAEGGGISAKLVKELRDKTGGGMMDCKKALVETNGDLELAVEYLRKKGLVSADKKASRVAAEGSIGAYIHAGARLGVLVEVNCETDFVARGDKFKELVKDIAMQIAACPEIQCVSVEDVPPELVKKETDIEMEKEDIKSKPEAIRGKIVEGRIAKTLKTWALVEQPFIRDTDKTVAEVVKEAVSTIGENIQIRRFTRYVLGEGIEKKVADLAKDVEEQTKAFEAAAAAKAAAAQEEAAPAAEAAPAKPAVEVSAKLVKELRDRSGAGMMDCKKALVECGGDLDAASDYLRKKGIISADKKSGRVASEGAIGSYIHAGSRLGVVVEVNCETDFVARGPKFQELVKDLAMQIAACPSVTVVAVEDVPASELDNERRIEMEKEDIKSKPEAMRGKIVEGRVAKIAKERALLEQPFIRENNKTVGEVIKEAIAGIGENIQVRRFSRYTLGEGIEKKVSDFAAEVAAQTGGVA